MIKELNSFKKDWGKRLKERIEKTQSERDSIDWLKIDWKEKIIKHYEELYEKEFKPHLLSFLNHKLKIRIVELIERESYRVYSMVSPWMIDGIAEIMINLTTKEKGKLYNQGLTEVEPLTNEKSRWIYAGTLLTNNFDNKIPNRPKGRGIFDVTD